MDALRQELADTQKRLQAYADRVTYLSHELQSLRESICISCRQKFVAPSNPSPVSSQIATNDSSESSPAEPANFWRHIWRQASPVRDFPIWFIVSYLSRCRSNSTPNPTPFITEQPIAFSPSPAVPNWSVNQDEIANGTLLITFVRSFILHSRIRSLRFSPDGKHLAALLRSSTRHNTEILFFDVETGDKTCALMDYTLQHLSTERFNVLCMCFGPNGRYLVVGDTSGRVTVWDIPNKRIRNIFKNHSNSVESVDVSPDGRLVASASGDKTVRIWNMRDGSTRILSDSAQRLWSVMFSPPNGQYVVAGNSAGVLMIWNSRSGQLLDKWSGHQRVVLDVVFLPDGKGLVSGSGDLVVKYWDVSSAGGSVATEILEYKGHTKAIKSVAISSDAQWIASASYDKTVILWATHTAARQCTLIGHEDAVVSVDFSPAGTYLVTGGQDGHAALWKVGSDL